MAKSPLHGHVFRAVLLAVIFVPHLCLAEDLVERTLDGAKAAVDEIQIGDSVVGLTATGERKIGYVSAKKQVVHLSFLRIFHEGCELPTALTGDRLVLKPNGWQQADQLRAGDDIVTRHGARKVTAIEECDQARTFYELRVRPFGNYFQNGIALHNWSVPDVAKETDLHGAWVGELEHHWVTMYRLSLTKDGQGLLAARNGADTPHKHLYRVKKWSLKRGRFQCLLEQIDNEEHDVPIAIEGVAYPHALHLNLTEYTADKKRRESFKLRMTPEAEFLAELKRRADWNAELARLTNARTPTSQPEGE